MRFAASNSQTAMYDALIRSPLYRAYTSAFQTATGLSLHLQPANPAHAKGNHRGPDHSFCALVQQTPRGRVVCQRVQAELTGKLQHKLAPHQIRCFAGLTDVMVPVLVGGEHIATLCAGRVLLQRPTEQSFRRVARVLTNGDGQTNLARLEAAYFRVPVLSVQRYRSSVRLLNVFALYLAEVATRCTLARQNGEPGWVTKARNFIAAHADQPLTARVTAKQVGLSYEYFCHGFRRHTGLKFLEHVRRTRVEKAKLLLLKPAVSISDVAFAAGFQSVSQFDHAFKKYVGLTPHDFCLAQKSCPTSPNS